MAISACVPTHTWVAGPAVNPGDFDQTSARCSLMARHSGSDFAVAGSQSYVAGAVVGHNISEANRTQADYNDCMLTQGWKIADQPTTAAAPVAPPTLPPAPPSTGGLFNGRWVSDVPVQGRCQAAHLVIDVRGDTISGVVTNPGGTFPITGSSSDSGNGKIRINGSDANSGTIRFSGDSFVADYMNTSCGQRHAEGRRG